MNWCRCGNLIYAVGTISAIGQGSNTYTRSNAFSFSATTGALTSWAPVVNAQVNSIALTPDCSTAYLGGSFTQINGTAAKDIAAVDTTTGALKTGFGHTANAEVDTVQYTHGLVLAGGVFTSINRVARDPVRQPGPDDRRPRRPTRTWISKAVTRAPRCASTTRK